MKYRKKPVEIEAFCFNGIIVDSEGRCAAPGWAVDALENETLFYDEGELYIKTLEGNMKATIGDYIIQGVQGEIYPCKPNIFVQTYEPLLGSTKRMSRNESFLEWLENNWEKDNLCGPCLSDQKAIGFLKDYLLGRGWYIAMPVSGEQANVEIVGTILEKYSRQYRRELRKARRNRNHA